MSLAAADLRRDVRVIGTIGAAHGLSHFYQLCWAPILALSMAEFGFSYTEAGIVVAVFFGVSGVCQTIAGFAVDRFGARPVLVFGLAVTAGAVALSALATGWPILVALAALGGIGNSVFHPADFAILNASVDPKRIGRAYSVHGLGGTLGWAAGPIVLLLGEAIGWRGAALCAAALGFAMALAVAGLGGVVTDHRAAHGGGGRAGPAPALGAMLSLPVLMCFGYFAFMASNSVGIQQFAVPAMGYLFDMPVRTAALVLSAFLVATCVGIVLGGFLADRTARHDRLAAFGLAAASLCMLPLALDAVGAWGAAVLFPAAGFCAGATGPSRDMIVRAATPPGATGKVFGFVYSGLDLGSTVSPLVFGALLDGGMPSAIFWIAVGLYLLSVPTVLQIRRISPPRLAAAAA